MGVKQISWLSALAALSLCAAGCGGESDGPPTAASASSTTVTEAAAADEPKPTLFNPCTEISVSDLEAAGLENVEPRPESQNALPEGAGYQCGWRSSDLNLVIAATSLEFDKMRPRIDSESAEEIAINGTRALRHIPAAFDASQFCALTLDAKRGLVTFEAVILRPDKQAPDSSCVKVTSIAEGLSSKIEGENR